MVVQISSQVMKWPVEEQLPLHQTNSQISNSASLSLDIPSFDSNDRLLDKPAHQSTKSNQKFFLNNTEDGDGDNNPTAISSLEEDDSDNELTRIIEELEEHIPNE
ncbi:hypothetical protein K3495_g9973 [Podosphaera aphanis]|nr:hypothetical protein K3495_g9973 [Podosphaera aphanis]